MSTKLTVALRTSIVDAVIDHRFKRQIDEAEDMLRLLGDRVYMAIYGAHFTAMKALPDGFFGEDDSMYVSSEKHGRVDVYLSAPRMFPRREELFQFDRAEFKELDAYVEQDRAVNAMRKQQADARRQVFGVVNSVTTVKRLVEVWPEVAPFLPAAEQKSRLPVLVPEQLNRLLDLPVDAP